MRKIAVERKELKKITTNLEDKNGGTTWACVAVTASIALCPTTKCTSKCR